MNKKNDDLLSNSFNEGGTTSGSEKTKMIIEVDRELLAKFKSKVYGNSSTIRKAISELMTKYLEV